MRTGGPKGKCYPAVQAGCVVMVLMKKVKRDYWRPKDEISGALDDDLLKAKSWNKKLHDYEANMPDRWGHSGYKELYPEEFETVVISKILPMGKNLSPELAGGDDPPQFSHLLFPPPPPGLGHTYSNFLSSLFECAPSCSEALRLPPELVSLGLVKGAPDQQPTPGHPPRPEGHRTQRTRPRKTLTLFSPYVSAVPVLSTGRGCQAPLPQTSVSWAATLRCLHALPREPAEETNAFPARLSPFLRLVGHCKVTWSGRFSQLHSRTANSGGSCLSCPTARTSPSPAKACLLASFVLSCSAQRGLDLDGQTALLG
ncbi:hypothetical protein J1605_014525 [Eschrichtius robustus]|uniref:Uncharacterized protein n=1 Tax=Eschrichtius robustus TaxID=9764 RepID=A0AB34GDI0_ESCRO|nr:hypothetical protein J1605_014525 [Eschrichtius robustus]